jgi:hypothetical protein
MGGNASANDSGARLCENSFFDHRIHLLDLSKFLILKIGSLPNFASALFTRTRAVLGRRLMGHHEKSVLS